MSNQTSVIRRVVMDKGLNPLGSMSTAARHQLVPVLVWSWSIISALAFLSIFAFGYVWLSHVLLVAGVFMTIAISRRAASRRQARAPAPYLSRASKCVWQMDREA